MRNLKVLCIPLLLLASSAFAGPKEDAFQLAERWAKAFTEADVDTIVSLYASDAAFIGTGSKTIIAQPEDIKKYYQGILLGNRHYVATFVDSNVTPASEATFVVTVLDKLVVTVDGKTQDLFGRTTFVVAKRDSGWKIVGFHRSTMPS